MIWKSTQLIWWASSRITSIPCSGMAFTLTTPTMGKLARAALRQQSILVDMLNALIKVENDLSNIRDIVRVEQRGGKQFHLSQGQAHARVAEKTIQRYGGGEASTQPTYEPQGPDCFGCGGPHQWSKLTNGKYVVICPRANKPGVREKAELNIQKYQAWKKRNVRNNKKRKKS
jgi:hypothetical protein